MDDKVYVSDSDNLLEYTPDTDTWVSLPTPTVSHGLLSLNGKVALVSGKMKASGEYSSEIHVREIHLRDGEIEQQWTVMPYRLKIARSNPGCACYKHYLIVAGGHLEMQSRHQSTNSVEVIDTINNRQYEAPAMPISGRWIESVIIGETLYLLLIIQGVALSRSILRVSLPTLTSHATQGHIKSRYSNIWEKMQDVPFYNTTLFSIGNMLLTAGGSGGTVSGVLEKLHLKSSSPSADIYLFNPHTSQWVKVGELPEAVLWCGCTILPSGKLLVAGGSCGVREGQDKATVYTATIVIAPLIL